MNKEYRIRHRNKNILMYAASEIDANILYATEFSCPDPFMFVRSAGGRRYAVMSDLEIDRARRESSAHRVLSLSQYTKLAKERTKKAPGTVDIMTTVLKDLRIKSVVVPATFPIGIADKLRKNKIRVTALDEPFYPERLYKKPAEVKAIKKAMRATERGLQAGMDALKSCRIKDRFLVYKGRRLTAEMLREVINTTILSLGFVPSGTIVAPGKQGCDPHDRGSGVIRADEPIIIDVFPRSEETGYFADITRTVVRGKASPKTKKMYDAVLAGQRLGLKMIRHGVRAARVHEAIVDVFEKRGFHTGVMNGRMQGFIHSTGHGLGLEIHEPPRIAANNITLEKGMVVTVEPGLYYYPTGGIRIEDTVLVTRTGIENLTRFPKFLEI